MAQGHRLPALRVQRRPAHRGHRDAPGRHRVALRQPPSTPSAAPPASPTTPRRRPWCSATCWPASSRCCSSWAPGPPRVTSRAPTWPARCCGPWPRPAGRPFTGPRRRHRRRHPGRAVGHRVGLRHRPGVGRRPGLASRLRAGGRSQHPPADAPGSGILDTRRPQRVQLVTTRSASYTRPGAPPAPGPPGPASRRARRHSRARARSWAGPAARTFGSPPACSPDRTRDHLMAFYGFARLVDQLGDAYDGDRLAALDWLESETQLALVDPERRGLHPLVARAAAARSAPWTPTRSCSPTSSPPTGRTRWSPATPPSTSWRRTAACPPTRSDGWSWLPSARRRHERQRLVRRHLHRPPARRALAGRRRGRPRRPHLPAGRRHGPVRRRPAERAGRRPAGVGGVAGPAGLRGGPGPPSPRRRGAPCLLPAGPGPVGRGRLLGRRRGRPRRHRGAAIRPAGGSAATGSRSGRLPAGSRPAAARSPAREAA